MTKNQYPSRKELRKQREQKIKRSKNKKNIALTATLMAGVTGATGVIPNIQAHAMTTEHSQSTIQVEKDKQLTQTQKDEFIKKTNELITKTLKSDNVKSQLKNSELIAYAIQRSNWGTESYSESPQNNIYALPMIQDRDNFKFENSISNNGDLATYKNTKENLIDFIKLAESHHLNDSKQVDVKLSNEIKDLIKDNHLEDFDNEIQTYTVIAGNTLSSIAEKFNVSIQSILSENNLTIDQTLQIGQKLKIKNGSSSNNTVIIDNINYQTQSEETPAPPQTETPSEETTVTPQPEVPSEETPATPQPETPNEETPVTPQPETPNEETPATPQLETPSEETPSEETPINPQPEVPNEETPATPQTETPSEETLITPPSASNSSVVAEAEKYLGTPYVWGGKDTNGFDCSGLTQYAYRQATGKEIGEWTVAQESSGQTIPVSQAQAGDLYFWGEHGSTYHVAIATGGGSFIHAPQPGENVQYGSTQYFTPDFAVRVN